jgi:hypothetical protein
MDGRYFIGVCAAIAAGVLFNVGSLMQKLAVMKSGSGAGLMRRLIKTPQWVAGFVLQMILGSPLNMLAVGLIGPVIIPGLSSVGLVVLALGAARFAKERFRAGEIAGIGLVMAAVTLFGFGGMSVDLRTVGIYEQMFLMRLGLFSTVLVLLCVTLHTAQKRYTQWAGVLRTLDAGVLLSLSNIWLGVLTMLLAEWVRARFALSMVPYVFVASAVVAAGSMLGIAETQRAFALGEASKLLPIQYLPSQIIPVVAYFIVFQQKPVSALSLPLTLIAIVCVLIGSILLAGRQMSESTVEEVPLVQNT